MQVLLALLQELALSKPPPDPGDKPDDEPPDKLEELRFRLRQIEGFGISRAAIARGAGVEASKISRFLGSSNNQQKGIRGESALRLWAFADKQERRAGNADFAEDAIVPPPLNVSVEQCHSCENACPLEVVDENTVLIPGALGLAVKWLGSITDATACIGLVTAAGGRLIVRSDDRNFGRKVEEFNQLWRGATAEHLVRNTNGVRLRRYLDAAWSLRIDRLDSSEYEVEITSPRGAVQPSCNPTVCALEPEGLELFCSAGGESALDIELKAVARQLPSLLESELRRLQR